MILVDSLTYDRSTTVLTARFRAPSAPRWATYEYRGVSPELYEKIRAAGPQRALTITREVAPDHEWRRVGSDSWCVPGVPSQPGPDAVLDAVTRYSRGAG
ncbi:MULTISPECIES: hypothetical protein [unclassified Actinotalea]|uniref:hypothetical protein n=1 Tax=unclassified Actinotalea TaxID=2638618 RepID=UPI0015F3E2A3|nr:MULTISPECIES: hypothetical protein [unclassified Actinotalea]